MKKTNPDILETVILNAQDDLFFEMISTGDVSINNSRVSIYDMLELLDCQEKDTVIAMLLRGNDEAKNFAHETLWQVFLSEFDSEAIDKHLVSEGEEY